MTRSLYAIGAALTAAALTSACDEATAPAGDASTVEITVYVDADGSGDFTAPDTPVAGLTIGLIGGPQSLSAETGSDGVARFASVPPGSYQAVNDNTAPDGATLATATAPVVVAQYGGGTVESEFRYAYLPGNIQGHVYRDDDESGDFDPDLDTPAAGLAVSLAFGSGGEDIASTTTDATGRYSFDGVRPTTYVVTATPFESIEFPAGNAQTVTVPPDGMVTADFVFVGNLVVDIAEARARDAGSVATVEAVATVGTGPFGSSSFYLQDATGGIAIFDGSRPDVEMGDLLRLTGTVGAFNDEIQLSGSVTIENLGTGTVPAPRLSSGADLNAFMFQGELVALNGFTVESVSNIDGFDNHNVNGKDAAGSDLVIRVDSRTGIGSAFWEVGTTYSVVGIASRFRDTFQLKPRQPDDVQAGGAQSIQSARDAAEGTVVTVEGTVSVDPGPFGSSSFYFQDASAGIAVFQSGAPEMDIGDVIQVTGTRSSFNDEVQLGNATVTIIEEDAGEPQRRAITAGDLNADMFQGELVTIAGFTVDSVTNVDGFDNHNVNGKDANGDDMVVRVDSRTGIGSAFWTAGMTYTVSGVASRFRDTFELKPRMPEDAVGGATSTVAQARALADGELVTVEGVVGVGPGPYGSSVFYFQDATAGIAVFMSGAPPLSPGDMILVTGQRSSFGNELQLGNTTVSVRGSGDPPTPRVVTGAEINAGQFQGEVASLAGYTVTGIEVLSFDNHVLTGTAGGEAVTVFVDSRSGIGSADWTVDSAYDLVGILRTSGDSFRLSPRGPADVTAQ
jgi:DNA/RNA endonuclease YhcR with UshA esterase domain